ncbi:hypothetical protein OQ968_11485 [Mycobacterium sp. 663a-19]|uniref:hypothetical protein n=1 Tax=Mycobacterium sp. 663a-19 TaxID=2986148 RepID=UPI002D1F7A4E|nr:hypothetical protein [Mycobacterium sp. 663a-19]MEB3981887.1 hypothetical protein [Mycobacterium sp. 663a-19]
MTDRLPIDFGIARAADETRMTKSGHLIGTFQYIAKSCYLAAATGWMENPN